MPRQIDKVASVYARSLYELAEAAGGTEKVTEIAAEIEAVAEIVRGDARFREFLASPIIGRDRRSSSVRAIFDGRVSDIVLRFLLVVNDHGRLGHLESIADAYDALVQDAMGKVEVDVYTVSGPPLGDELEAAISARVRESIGKEPILHTHADPSMIGGIKLRIGDQLIDGSIATRLRRMRTQLKERGNSAILEHSERFLSSDGA